MEAKEELRHTLTLHRMEVPVGASWEELFDALFRLLDCGRDAMQALSIVQHQVNRSMDDIVRKGATGE